MSEKQPGRSKGRATYRPDVSMPPLPPKEVVDQLLKNARNGSDEGMVAGCTLPPILGDRDHYDSVIRTKNNKTMLNEYK